MELSTDSFFDVVGKDKHVIVEFYTPWCGYCRKMAAEYESLWEYYNGPNPKRNDVQIARINGNDHQQMTMRFNIYAYPAILFFQKGQKEYKDTFEYPYRTKDYFSRWIENHAGPEEVKKEPEPVVKIEQNLRSEPQKAAQEAPAVEAPVANEANAEAEKLPEIKNITVTEQIHKVHDILVTLSDKINFIDQEHTRRLNEALKAIELSNEAHPLNIPNSGRISRNSVIFLFVGLFSGFFLALCIIKFRSVGSNHPELKTV